MATKKLFQKTYDFGGVSGGVYRFSMTNWDISTAVMQESTTTPQTETTRNIDIDYNGSTTFHLLDGFTGTINRYDSGAAGDINPVFTYSAAKSKTDMVSFDYYLDYIYSLPVLYSPTNIADVDFDTAVVYQNANPPTLQYSLKQTYYGDTNNGTTPKISYSYVRLIPDNYTGSINKDSIIRTDKDTTSINTLGLQARKISLPYLEIGEDLNRFNKKFILRNAYTTIPRRITIKTIGLINDVIENNKIGAYYTTKGIGSDDINGFMSPEYLTIKRIEYNYPESSTTIEIGDFLYDSFDLEKITAETVRGIQST